MKFSGLLIYVAVLFSCGEDESTPLEIVIDGKSHELVNGYYFDIEEAESIAGRVFHETHYAQSFILTDGILTEQLEELVCKGCTFQVIIEAFSAGAEAFTSDDFNTEDKKITQLSSTAAESYLFLTIEFTNRDESLVSVIKGTVSVDVNTPTFIFDFDFTGRNESSGSEVEISGRFKDVFQEMSPNLLDGEH